MAQNKQTPEQYLKAVYGLEPSDLDLDLGEGSFDIEEVERLAEKYNLTRKENISLQQAKAIMKTVGYHGQ